MTTAERIKNPPLEQNMFKGESLFVLATGTSLLDEPLELLRDKYTWGCGHLIDWEDLPFVPTFYGVGEMSSFRDMHERLEQMPTIRFAVVNDPDAQVDEDLWHRLSFIMSDHPVPRSYSRGVVGLSLPDEGRHYHPRIGEVPPPFPDEDELFHVPSLHGMSCVASAIWPAIWLGFNPIYLLGVDLDGAGYVYAPTEGRDDGNLAGGLDGLWRGLRVLHKKMDEMGVEVINCSKTTHDREFPHVPLEEVLARSS